MEIQEIENAIEAITALIMELNKKLDCLMDIKTKLYSMIDNEE